MFLGVLSLGFAGAVLACSGDGDEDEPTPMPSPSATATAILTPSATSSRPAGPTPVQPTPDLTPRPSGGELVDAVIEAVEGQDAAALSRLIHYFLAACTEPQAPSAIPCPEGQPPGSAVAAFGGGGCEGAFVLRDDPAAAGMVSDFLGTGRELWAVVQTQPFPGDERVPGKYMVIFENASGPAAGVGSAVSVDEEGVTYLHFGCGTASTPESFTHGSTEYLIPPQ